MRKYASWYLLFFLALALPACCTATAYLPLRGSGPIGFHALQFVVLLLLSSACLLPVIPVVVAAIAIALHVNRRPLRRWRSSCCPACAYPRHTAAQLCPECGLPLQPPRDSTIPLLSSLLSCVFLSWLLGAAIAESWALADEARFRHEVAAFIDRGGTGTYSRPRCWPMQHAQLNYKPEMGYWAHD
jgi:hypothetical protein